MLYTLTRSSSQQVCNMPIKDWELRIENLLYTLHLPHIILFPSFLLNFPTPSLVLSRIIAKEITSMHILLLGSLSRRTQPGRILKEIMASCCLFNTCQQKSWKILHAAWCGTPQWQCRFLTKVYLVCSIRLWHWQR